MPESIPMATNSIIRSQKSHNFLVDNPSATFYRDSQSRWRKLVSNGPLLDSIAGIFKNRKNQTSPQTFPALCQNRYRRWALVMIC